MLRLKMPQGLTIKTIFFLEEKNGQQMLTDKDMSITQERLRKTKNENYAGIIVQRIFYDQRA